MNFGFDFDFVQTTN